MGQQSHGCPVVLIFPHPSSFLCLFSCHGSCLDPFLRRALLTHVVQRSVLPIASSWRRTCARPASHPFVLLDKDIGQFQDLGLFGPRLPCCFPVGNDLLPPLLALKHFCSFNPLNDKVLEVFQVPYFHGGQRPQIDDL